MEEKERKQLKKRLLGLVINEPPYPYPITMAEVMVNDMSKPNLKPLLNFIEQELDRAREEVMFTEDEQRVLRFALKLQRDDIHKVWDEETFDTIWKKVGGLSKLNKKK